MKKILILQPVILHYRKLLYNELSKYYDVTVLHSGDTSIEKDDNYHEIITKLHKVGAFFLQSGVLLEEVSEYIITLGLFWKPKCLPTYCYSIIVCFSKRRKNHITLRS